MPDKSFVPRMCCDHAQLEFRSFAVLGLIRDSTQGHTPNQRQWRRQRLGVVRGGVQTGGRKSDLSSSLAIIPSLEKSTRRCDRVTTQGGPCVKLRSNSPLTACTPDGGHSVQLHSRAGDIAQEGPGTGTSPVATRISTPFALARASRQIHKIIIAPHFKLRPTHA